MLNDRTTELAFAAQAGDRRALEAFVRGTQADVWQLCARLTDRDRADDLTQETYERAWKALPRYRAEAPARLWLLAVARHVVADHIRRRARRRRLVEMGRLDDQGQPVPQGARDHATSHALESLLDDLCTDQRLAFILTQLLGLSYAEAAEVCGLPVGTIRSRVARARESLVQSYEEAATA